MNRRHRSQAGSTPSPSKLVFARHFAEMVLVMFVGMGLLAGVAALAFAASNSSLSDQSGGLRVTLMGVSMTAPMVAWMAYEVTRERGTPRWPQPC